MRHRAFECSLQTHAHHVRAGFRASLLTPAEKLKRAHATRQSLVCAECGAPAFYRYGQVGRLGLFGACEAHKATAAEEMARVTQRELGRQNAHSMALKRRRDQPSLTPSHSLVRGK